MWSANVTSITGTSSSKFSNISSAGVFSIVASSNLTGQGEYNVSISAVTVNKVVYDGSTQAKTLQFPSSFLLTVSPPVLSLVVNLTPIQTPVTLTYFIGSNNAPFGII